MISSERRLLLAASLFGIMTLVTAVLGAVALDKAVVEVGLTFSHPMPAGAQVFVAEGGSFSEKNSFVLPSVQAGERVDFNVPAGFQMIVRLDPPADQVMSLCSVAVEGFEHLGLGSYAISDSHQLRSLSETKGCLVAVPAAGAEDPQFVLRTKVEPSSGAGTPMFWLFAATLTGGFVLAMALWLGCTVLRGFTGWVVPLYVVMSLTFGTLYAIATPPGAVTDEYAHVTKAVKVAHGVMVGATGERAFPNIFRMYGPFDGYLNPSVHFSPMQLLNQIETPVACTPETAALPHGADAYPPQLYIVPAAAYALSCSLDGDLGFFLLLARIGNLVLATGLIAVGIWATIRARWVLIVCALLPMSIYQIASVSADSLSLALSFAWLGVVCGVAEGRVPVAKSGWLLVPLAVALAVSKPGSAWVLAAILFARPAYLSQAGTFSPAVLKYLVVPFIVHTVWVLYASGSAAPLQGVDPAENVSRFFTDPVSVIMVYWNTFLGHGGVWLLKSAIGVLGWLDVSLSSISYRLAVLALLASAFMGFPVNRPSVKVGAAALAISSGAVAMLAAPLYIYWTLPGSEIILGLQGRYFIPCMAFVLTFAAGSLGAGVAARRAHLGLTLLVPLILCIILVDGALALVERYYP